MFSPSPPTAPRWSSRIPPGTTQLRRKNRGAGTDGICSWWGPHLGNLYCFPLLGPGFVHGVSAGDWDLGMGSGFENPWALVGLAPTKLLIYIYIYYICLNLFFGWLYNYITQKWWLLEASYDHPQLAAKFRRYDWGVPRLLILWHDHKSNMSHEEYFC